jgi:hypothetical protein
MTTIKCRSFAQTSFWFNGSDRKLPPPLQKIAYKSAGTWIAMVSTIGYQVLKAVCMKKGLF